MKIKNCKNCHYVEWRKHKSGRRDFRAPGKCNYPDIIFPACYKNNRKEDPERNNILHNQGEGCFFWGKIKKEKEFIADYETGFFTPASIGNQIYNIPFIIDIENPINGFYSLYENTLEMNIVCKIKK